MLDISRPPRLDLSLAPICTAFCEEVGCMCVWKRFKAWRFTDCNQDYAVRAPSICDATSSASLSSSPVRHYPSRIVMAT
jgi:hypothetical protein